MIFSTLELLVSAELCSLDLKIAIEAPIEDSKLQWLFIITCLANLLFANARNFLSVTVYPLSFLEG